MKKQLLHAVQHAVLPTNRWKKFRQLAVLPMRLPLPAVQLTSLLKKHLQLAAVHAVHLTNNMSEQNPSSEGFLT